MEEIVNDGIVSLQNMKHRVNIDIRDKELVEKVLNNIDKDIEILKQGGDISFDKYADIRNKISKLGQFQSAITESNVSKEWENTILTLEAVTKF